MKFNFKLFVFGSFVFLCVLFLIGLHISEGNNHTVQLQIIKQLFKDKENEYINKRSTLLSTNKKLSEKLNEPYRGTTILKESEILFQNYTPSDKHAIVTMVGSSSYMHGYWLGAISLFQSLREVKTRVPNIVVMVRTTDNIPDVAFDIYENLGVKVILIEHIELDKLIVDIPGTWGKSCLFLL